MTQSKSSGRRGRHERLRAALIARPVEPDLSWHVQDLGGEEQHVRGGRSIFRLTAPGDARRLVLKMYDSPGMAAGRFRALKALRRRTDCVVQPRFLMPRFNLFGMDDAGTETVLDRMPAGAECTGVALCAGWLGKYARDVAEGERRFDASSILGNTAARMRKTAAAAEEGSDAAFQDIVDAFDRHSHHNIPHFQVFGDFKPSNLCISSESGRLTAVDYLPSGIMPLERDLAFMLHWVRQKRWRDTIGQGRDPRGTEESEDWQTALACLGRRVDESLASAFLKLFLFRMWVRLTHLGNEPYLQEMVRERLGMRSQR